MKFGDASAVRAEVFADLATVFCFERVTSVNAGKKLEVMPELVTHNLADFLLESFAAEMGIEFGKGAVVDFDLAAE